MSGERGGSIINWFNFDLGMENGLGNADELVLVITSPVEEQVVQD